MKTIEMFRSKLAKVSVEIKDYICDFFKENNLESINVLPYVGDGYINAFTFFDIDDDYGIALEVDAIKYNKDKNEFKVILSDYEGEHEVTCFSCDFDVLEMLKLATMLSMIKTAHETKNIPYLAIGEEFDFDIF